MNQKDIRKFIIASPRRDGFVVKHNIPGEAIVCEVPTLEIAGCIVKALRERQHLKQSILLLAKHMAKKSKVK
jgi:hypothetical protein